LTRKIVVVLTVLLMFIGLTAMADSGNEAEKSRLLIVDETESMETSMRVQGFVGAIKNMSDVAVLTRVVKTENPTANPLEDSKDLKVDAVVIVPSTIETGKIKQVWIATRPYSAVPLKMRKETMSMMRKLKNGIEKAFSGQVNAVGVNDDVIPAYFSTLFLREGVIR
jgi:hypothetical protein